MSKTFFVTMQALATLALPSALVLAKAERWLEAGVMGFLGLLAYILYEVVPTKSTPQS